MPTHSAGLHVFLLADHPLDWLIHLIQVLYLHLGWVLLLTGVLCLKIRDSFSKELLEKSSN